MKQTRTLSNEPGAVQVEFEANWLNLTNHHCWAQR